MKVSPIMLGGLAMIIIAVLFSTLVVAPVATKSSGSSPPLDGEGNDSLYSASVTLLDNGEVVWNHPFAFTSGGEVVTDMQVTVDWTVTGDYVDWATLQLTGSVRFDYVTEYDHWVKFKTVPFSGTIAQSSWSGTYPLSELCTADTDDNYGNWFFQITVTISVTALDQAGASLSDTLDSPLLGTIAFTTQGGALCVTATGPGLVAMDAVDGGIYPTNPSVIVACMGFIMIPVSIVVSKR